MTKLLRLFAALSALLLCGLAPAAARDAAPAVQVAHPALWKVEGPGATIYLFGTIHMLPANVHWLDGPVASAFGQSDTLVTEILETKPEELRPVLAATAMLPAGQTLRAMLTPAERQRLAAAMAANGLPADAFDRYRPWLAAVTLATTPMVKLGYDPANGVDVQLGQRAQAVGRPHEALETAAFQLGLFAALPQLVQKAYLMQVVKELPKVNGELAAIIRSWETGDADRLAKLMNSDEDDPQMMQTLLFDRNRTWAKWIQARLAKPPPPHETPHKTLFIAVGAGHLAGAGSVLDQLRALGIQSQRVQ